MHRLAGHAALLSSTLAVLLLAGCSAPEPAPEPAPAPAVDDGWSSRMSQVLTDPAGQGGADGSLTADAGSDEGSDDQDGAARVTLASVRGGEYDVLGVCRNADVVRLTVERLGSDGEPEETYGETDIPCGATVRLPVTIGQGGATIEATGPVGAEWHATIVTPDWQPGLTTFG